MQMILWILYLYLKERELLRISGFKKQRQLKANQIQGKISCQVWGYAQKQGIDFQELFPRGLCVLFALTSMFDLELCQLDVKDCSFAW